MIKGILFDVGGVLLKLQVEVALEMLKSPISSEIIKTRFNSWHKHFEYEKGFISTEDFLTSFRDYANVYHNDEQLLKVWNTIVDKPLPGVEELINEISGKVDIYTLSNTNQSHYEHFVKNDFFTHFKKTYTSFELGARKPDDEIYQKMLEDIEHSPDSLLFIDDNEENLEVARKFGINAEHSVDSIERTRDILRKYNIL